MTDVATFVIVGGGQAGGRAAEAMRAAGFAGRIVILGDEPVRPYERPPLSKQVLTGDAAADEAVFLRDPAYYDAHGIEVWPNHRVTAIERDARQVRLAGGGALAYDKLLLATGARARRLPVPGADLESVHYLRTLLDSQALAAELSPERRVVIVGGGYIGLEVAAAARKRECEVTVLEAGGHVMQRQVAPEVGDWMARQHRARGVDLQTGYQVAAFEAADDGHVAAVRGSDGRQIPADLVVVGVGATPNVELAAEAGLGCDDGILVDEYGQTDDPAIYAAGDATRHPNPILNRSLRLESWQNAQFQAEAAGRSMAGDATVYRALPWFWSDQFDLNCQMVGLPETWDHLVWRGDPDTDNAFSVFYLCQGRVVAANAVNQGKDIAPARRLIEQRLIPDANQLADTRISLKKILKAVQ